MNTSRNRPKDEAAMNGRKWFLMFSKRPGFFLTTMLLTVMAGCMTAGPDYVRHPVSTPGTWHTDFENGIAKGPFRNVSGPDGGLFSMIRFCRIS